MQELKNRMLRLVQGLKNRMLKEMMMMIGYMKAWRGDFGDDIFVAPNSAPQGSAPASGNAPNTAQHTASESSNAPHAARETSGITGLNGGDGTEWAELALEDDLVSIDGSDDE